MSDLVTQAEAARRLGVSPPAINKLVKSGKLPLVNGKIHMETAEAVLLKNLDPARSKILQGMAPSRKDDAKDSKKVVQIPVDYSVSKARREHHEANMAEMKERKLAGELVDRAAVESAAYRVGRLTRDAIMAIPVKISPDMVNAADHWEAQQILTKALRKALDDVATLSSADVNREMDAC